VTELRIHRVAPDHRAIDDGEDGTASLVVSEVFGPTFQGEGPSAGRLAMFVRLGRCNLDCSWCDTAYTWDWTRFDPDTELHRRTVGEVVAELARVNVPLLVITGGEPLLQQRHLVPLVRAARTRGWRVEVETNGTIAPLPALSAMVDQWNVSPKLAGSGVDLARRWQPEALHALARTGRAIAKFVVRSASELDEAAAVAEAGHLSEVWIMPEATDAATLVDRLGALAPDVLSRGWHLSSRLQILLWGDQRGR
jgi:7-carboxy-7-deazaguanine synthase